MEVRRREYLGRGAATASGLLLVGCSEAPSSVSRIDKIVVSNFQYEPNTIRLLVYCDGEPRLWRSFDYEARQRDADGPPPGTVLRDVTDLDGDCRVHALLNDGEDDATLDLAEFETDCVRLQVYAEESGPVTIYYSTSCE